jgi:hypothetical protein
MGKWDYSAVHGINLYIWQRLKDELNWNANNYGGLIPITTPEQQPEFNSFNAPYIVYSYSPQGTDPDWIIEGEVIAYTVFSANSSDIRQAINVMKASLNRFDESAKDVNSFIKSSTLATADIKAFDYKVVRVTSASGPQPALQEGGRRDGSLILTVRYTHSGSNGLSIRY